MITTTLMMMAKVVLKPVQRVAATAMVAAVSSKAKTVCTLPTGKPRGIVTTLTQVSESTIMTTSSLAQQRQKFAYPPCTQSKSTSSGSGKFTSKTSTHYSRLPTPRPYRHASSMPSTIWKLSVLPSKHLSLAYIVSQF